MNILEKALKDLKETLRVAENQHSKRDLNLGEQRDLFDTIIDLREEIDLLTTQIEDLESKSVKGLICDIYKHNGSSCSNNGISSAHESVLLVGDGIPEIFDSVATGLPVVRIENHYKTHYRAVEVNPTAEGRPMYGGCFIYTSDSRFPHDFPVKLHDRFE